MCILKSLEIRKIYPNTKLQMTMMLVINSNLLFRAPAFEHVMELFPYTCDVRETNFVLHLNIILSTCNKSLSYILSFTFLDNLCYSTQKVLYSLERMQTIQASGILSLTDKLKGEFLSFCSQVSRKHLSL